MKTNRPRPIMEHPIAPRRSPWLQKSVLGLALVGVLTASGTAEAATATYSASIPLTSLDWDPPLLMTLPRFDPSLGRLDSVTVSVDANIEAVIGLENRDPNLARTLKGQAFGDISVLFPPPCDPLVDSNGCFITAALPASSLKTFAAAKFDGLIDFAGTSGKTFTGVTGSASSGPTDLTSAADMAYFIGLGTVDIPASAFGSSTTSGSSNMSSSITTSAAATATVVYTYTPPTPEICDGIDSGPVDGLGGFDGIIDNDNPGGGLPCATGGVGICGVGTTLCAGGQIICVQNAPPSVETCDGLDNDCDGAVDNGSPGSGTSCSSGQPGVCAAGTTACSNGGIVCNPSMAPSAETCDGLDNNCDGLVDNGNPGGGAACNTGIPGACGAGTTVCAGGAIVCSPNVAPGVEACDGLDNNCDGMVDNGNPGGGMGCSTGSPGVCSAGTTACTGGAIVCNQNAAPSAEACDGLDNNCDGAVDNDNPGGGMGCSTGIPGICGPGTTACSGGAVVCNQNAAPTAEACDGLDNNCDGMVDNGNPGGGMSCSSGQPGACAAGTTACSNGGLVCNAISAPSPEACDGVDNNCDGVVDNGNPGGGASCSSGQPGVCAAGTTACSNGGLVCNASMAPSAETCDGLDNNCDGLVDNGNPGGGMSCNSGQPGACSAGTTACSGGLVVCNASQAPGVEVCDGVDNNCNGSVDEGFDGDQDGIADCFDPQVCGNDIVEAGEFCDDGNTVGGDACAANCQQLITNCVTIENQYRVPGGPILTNVDDAVIVTDVSDPTKANTNLGLIQQMATGYNGLAYQRILMKFDVPANIPQGAIVISAALKLRMIQSPGKSPVDLYAISGQWNELTITWNQFALLPNGGLGALQSSLPTLGVPNNSNISLPLSVGLIESWNDPAQNFGLVLDHPLPGRTLFGSSDAYTAGPRPKLQVCYEEPSCFDGVQNGGEAGIDCGHPCLDSCD